MSRYSTRATPDECSRPMIGDDLIHDPIGSVTCAITIRCTPDTVWPWIAQMGAGRAGWYSYDSLDNGGKPSAHRIIPELQDVEVGFIFPWLPGATEGFIVLACDPGHSLVLGAPGRGIEPLITWAFILEAADGDTRLIVRARAGPGCRLHGLPGWVTKYVAPPGHFIMQRKQLLGIARRAERDRRARVAEPSPRKNDRVQAIARCVCLLIAAGLPFLAANGGGAAAAPAARCAYRVWPPSVSLDATGGRAIVYVTAEGYCTWTAASDRGWIAITSPASGTGEGSVTLRVADNPTGLERTGTLNVGSERVVVTQAGSCEQHDIMASRAASRQ